MIDKEAIQEKVINVLKQIYDPEIPVNIYDLGLVYNLSVTEEPHGIVCRIEMTLTSPGCPVADMLIGQVQSIAYIVDEIDEVMIDLVFEPPWSEERISYEGKLELGLL
jgi:metal-sulfur cluster biosynthetic enzyme